MATASMSTTGKTTSNPALQSYYATFESRWGYRLILGDTRHFGFYPLSSSIPWPWTIPTSLRNMEHSLLNALNLPQGSLVLDAGCGAGHVARYMINSGNLRVHGIDIVARHVSLAQQQTMLEKVQLGDYHHLDSLFEPGKFDGVYTMETFVHATDPKAVLRQFMRVLRPGGRLAMHEYDHIDYDSDGGKEGKEAGKIMRWVNEGAAMPTNQMFVPGVLEVMLKEAGFVDVEVRDLSKHVWPMLWLFFLLAWLPYRLIRLCGRERDPRFVNTVAGYWSWKGRRTWRYVQVVARKPEENASRSE